MPESVECTKEITEEVVCDGMKNHTSYCICEFPRCKKMHSGIYYTILERWAEQPADYDKINKGGTDLSNDVCDFIKIEVVTESSVIELIKLIKELHTNMAQKSERDNFGIWIIPSPW